MPENEKPPIQENPGLLERWRRLSGKSLSLTPKSELATAVFDGVAREDAARASVKELRERLTAVTDQRDARAKELSISHTRVTSMVSTLQLIADCSRKRKPIPLEVISELERLGVEFVDQEDAPDTRGDLVARLERALGLRGMSALDDGEICRFVCDLRRMDQARAAAEKKRQKKTRKDLRRALRRAVRAAATAKAQVAAYRIVLRAETSD